MVETTDKTSRFKTFIKNIKTNLYVLYHAYLHVKTPWYAKAFSLIIVAYALSPIDLIPDIIPVLGYLDEAILIPMGIYGAFLMIPKSVLQECKMKASRSQKTLQKNWGGAVAIILLWSGLFTWILFKWMI